MPSKAVIAAIGIALAIAGLKFVGVSAHLPPYAVPADIVAQNKERAFTMRTEPANEPAYVATADQKSSPIRLSLNAR